MYNKHKNKLVKIFLFVFIPFSFMDVAIKSKLYLKLSISMIERALLKAMDHKKEISLNLSTIDIKNLDFINMLDGCLNNTTTLAKQIIFEILEDQNIDRFQGFYFCEPMREFI